MAYFIKFLLFYYSLYNILSYLKILFLFTLLIFLLFLFRGFILKKLTKLKGKSSIFLFVPFFQYFKLTEFFIKGNKEKAYIKKRLFICSLVDFFLYILFIFDGVFSFSRFLNFNIYIVFLVGFLYCFLFRLNKFIFNLNYYKVLAVILDRFKIRRSFRCFLFFILVFVSEFIYLSLIYFYCRNSKKVSV